MAVRRSASPTRPVAQRAAGDGAGAHSPFIAHCLELLAPLGVPRARRMFGGYGLYLDDLFIAIVQDETLYLKVDGTNQPHFEAAGSEPFRYHVRGELRDLSFWRTPEEAMESPALMAPWARLALEAALRKRAEDAPKRPAGKRSSAAAKPTQKTVTAAAAPGPAEPSGTANLRPARRPRVRRSG